MMNKQKTNNKKSAFNSNSSKNKSDKRDFRSNSRRTKKDTEDAVQSKSVKADKYNDPSWYLGSNQLAADVANLNFNNPTGIVYNLDLNNADAGSFVTPGVMNMYMGMGPGVSVGTNSGVDTAMRGIYAKLRSDNSGAKNYDAPDLMMYILSMGQAYAMYAWLTRLYGFARIYVQQNKYMGENLIKACGVNPADIVGDLAHFRAFINQYAMKLGVFWVPANMSLFKRWVWMFSNVYADEDTTKAQFYMYQPAYILEYLEQTGGPGMLAATPLTIVKDTSNDRFKPAENISLSMIEGIANDLVRRLASSNDILVMSGDILKAYGAEGCYSISLIPEDYTVMPVFSEEVLLQIHNTTFAGSEPINPSTSVVELSSFNVTQNASIGSGALVWSPVVKQGYSLGCKKVFDSWKAAVTPEDVLVGTRNMICGYTRYNATDNRYTTQITSCGTEVPMFGSLYTLKANGDGEFTQIAINDVNPTSGQQSVMKLMTKIKYFNQHPFFYYAVYGDDGVAVLNAATSFGEMSNYTIIDETTLRRIHDTAVMSMFDVPSLGNIIKA